MATAAVATGAHAAPHLDYHAAAGCPADTEFVAAVRARGGDVDLAGGTQGINVEIDRTSGGYRGTVRVSDGGQSSKAREVRSTQCDEVAEGLAIVTALASQTGDLPDTTSEPATNADAAAPPTGSTEAAQSPAAKPAPAVTVAKPATRLHTVGQFHDETLTVSSGALRVRSDTAFTLTGGALVGITPGAAIPRFDLTFARTNFITTPDGAGHIIGGILRSRWTLLTPLEYRKDGWSAQWLGVKASIGGCAQLVYDLEGLALLFCGELGAGMAKVTTKNPAGHVTKDELLSLGSAALDLDARYHMGRYFYADLALGVEAWLSQIKAVKSDGGEIFHARPLGAFVTAGVGLHFW